MILKRLTDELGLALPVAPRPIGVYVPAVRTGNLLFLSGQLPTTLGELPATFRGKVGDGVTVEAAQEAARQATLNALAIVHDVVTLDNVVRVVRLAGHVASAPGFTAQPQVLNAASELLGALFGEAGRHARLALGAAVLPLDACVEIELILEVRD